MLVNTYSYISLTAKEKSSGNRNFFKKKMSRSQRVIRKQGLGNENNDQNFNTVTKFTCSLWIVKGNQIQPWGNWCSWTTSQDLHVMDFSDSLWCTTLLFQAIVGLKPVLFTIAT